MQLSREELELIAKGLMAYKMALKAGIQQDTGLKEYNSVEISRADALAGRLNLGPEYFQKEDVSSICEKNYVSGRGYTVVSLVNGAGTVRVAWFNLGEGYSGDFNEEDPEDTNLLRFDVFKIEDGRWVEAGDASYCTRVPASTPQPVLENLLRSILARVEEPLKSGASIKRICQELSWLDAEGHYIGSQSNT